MKYLMMAANLPSYDSHSSAVCDNISKPFTMESGDKEGELCCTFML